MSADSTDVEMTMHAYRLMRSGRIFKAHTLIAEMKLDFPSETEERIRRVLANLAITLRDAE